MGSASTQTFPNRPITMVVPFPAGGPTDTVARIYAERMRVSLGQPVIVENVFGAAGSIGTGRVARSPADGHTLILGDWSTHAINGAIYALSYDVVKDFEPVALISSNPSLIEARKSFPADDLRSLIAWLKANPDKATQGTCGSGCTAHLFGSYFQSATGTRFQFVPYRGLGLAMQDLVAGQIDLIIGDGPANALPQLRAGTIKVYAVTAKNRLAAAPDIPTTDEAGLPGFHTSFWRAIFAPRATSKEIIAKLSAAAIDAMGDPTVRMRLADLGIDIPPRDQQTPEALSAFQKAEIDKWWPIIRAGGIKAE